VLNIVPGDEEDEELDDAVDDDAVGAAVVDGAAVDAGPFDATAVLLFPDELHAVASSSAAPVAAGTASQRRERG